MMRRISVLLITTEDLQIDASKMSSEWSSDSELFYNADHYEQDILEIDYNGTDGLMFSESPDIPSSPPPIVSDELEDILQTSSETVFEDEIEMNCPLHGQTIKLEDIYYSIDTSSPSTDTSEEIPLDELQESSQDTSGATSPNGNYTQEFDRLQNLPYEIVERARQVFC
jgi:hypothetical protein